MTLRPFIPAGEILGETALVRTLTLRGHAILPDGAYAMIDTYCTDPACDCRKTIVMVHHDGRHVSTINYGWESAAFYRAWFKNPIDPDTMREMRGPSIAMGSPDLVPQQTMLAFFHSILDDRFREHFRSQYARFRAAIATGAGDRLLTDVLGRAKIGRNQPCPCGSGKKYKLCCARLN